MASDSIRMGILVAGEVPRKFDLTKHTDNRQPQIGSDLTVYDQAFTQVEIRTLRHLFEASFDQERLSWYCMLCFSKGDTSITGINPSIKPNLPCDMCLANVHGLAHFGAGFSLRADREEC